MKAIKSLLVIFLFVSFFSCKNKTNLEEVNTVKEVSTYYFIRHAEKDRSNPDNIDPELIQKGLGRAMHWAEIFDDIELDAIYSTDFLRSSMTAAPTSVKKNIDVKYYNFDDINVNQFKKDHANQNILIVGHADTSPEFVNQLLEEDKYSSMEDYDNGSLFIVQITNGIATSQRLHINCNCPD
ncbi:broad specificity phosphatase PhoE [Maribacter vaceletii]|uniref:Broad specificity phosphatase PhoE n=1 Tax=Maribacter vaceletii TaxID=1206816 RepID=A0A495E9K1_9FLAO|nr:phosphoglycerate mutase family protein [Maribacter vaceletii]RKR13371.1 broad specificity phosphatase PhoE [Maribacter vaceletii]